MSNYFLLVLVEKVRKRKKKTENIYDLINSNNLMSLILFNSCIYFAYTS